MAEQKPNEHHLSGRLLAALWTIRLLAGKAGPAPRREDLVVKQRPLHFLDKELASLSVHVLAAKCRGGGHWDAAAEVFREVPDLLPPQRVLADNMSPAEQRAFAAGYAEQRAAYAEKYGRLVEG
ncbi:hypothetical protein [Streptomyces sp. NRRL S-340]|uniref:hypothetical protein n=1 Tax=Streptomyces sp. NRRL S-340 TaxID=1463901 RepID=UPI00056C640F|nr:hypothetical protein [Streptomyces sp. NRRL S-340]